MRSREASQLASLLLAGCIACAPARPDRRSGGAGDPLEPQTTADAIAFGNLGAEIESLERLEASHALHPMHRTTLVQNLMTRGQYAGRIADYERAEAIAEDMVCESPADGAVWLARAGARATFHRFDDALVDLAEAEARGARRDRVEAARAAIDQARGSYRAALAVREPAARARPGVMTTGAVATIWAEAGETERAHSLFVAAPATYRDVSPFPLAWLAFQEGTMWMEEGDLETAKALLASAHRRLPSYAAATGHLAEVEAALGNRQAAIELLRPLASASDDPDYAAQLARILDEAGEREEAVRWRDAASARFAVLLDRHPEAFADHAAEFWLGAGGDPARALALARANLDNRPTPRAYRLALQAALAARADGSACELADAIERRGPRPAAVKTLADRALSRCGKDDRNG